MTSLRPLCSPAALTALALLAGATACTADEPSPDTSAAAAPILNGAAVSAAARPAAVFLQLTIPQGSISCTGTLIAPNLVLTAGHCTRCATGAQARILGEHPDAPTGTVGAVPFYLATAAGISTHPAAFTGSIDCNQAPELVDEELSDKVDVGADLGLVRLTTSSNITPAKVLLAPPTGFSPVQDLFGAQVAIVGRGRPAADNPQLSVMRQGSHDLSSFDARKSSCEAPGTQHFALNGARASDEAIIMSGDSGGPMFATVPAVGERVIGVASASALNFLSFHAPTFTFSNAAFLSQALTGNFFGFDHDGDDVIDAYDNCPLDANTDQIDRDGDGRGDVCDNCTPLDPATGGHFDLTEFDGPPANAASFSNWAQDNANQEAEDRQILSAMPGLVTPGGEVRRITNLDYRSALGSDEVCRAGALGAITKQRRGDKCDVIPAAPANATYSSLPNEDFVGGTILPCAVTGYAIGTCSFEVTSGFRIKGVIAGSTTTSKVGLRHCRCDLEHGTPAQRRLNCSGSPFQCAIDPALYQLDHPRWRKLDLDGADANGEKLTSVNLPGGEATVGWDALADLVGLTGQPLPPKPWSIDENDDLVGGPTLHGVLWSHVVQLGSTPIGNRPDDGARNFAKIASTYGDGDLRFKRVVHWKKIPRYKPAHWWEYCAMCGVNPAQKWLEVVSNPAGGPQWVIAVGPEGGVDVSGAVDSAARALLARTDVVHVNASEPEAMLRGSRARLRSLVVQSGSLDVIGGLGPVGDKLSGQIFGARGATAARAAAAPIAIAAADPIAWAYSATRGELYAVRQDATGRVQLHRFDEERGTWSVASTYGASLTTPRAAVYSPQDEALFVLDRGEGSAIRLMRVDVRDGRTNVVNARLLDGTYASVGLTLVAPDAATPPGSAAVQVLVAAGDARGRVTRLARLKLPFGRTPLWQIDTATHAGEELAGDAQSLPDGSALFLVPVSGGFEPRSVAPAAFLRVDAAVAKPLF